MQRMIVVASGKDQQLADHRDLLLDLAQLVSERRSLAGVFEEFARRLLRAAAFEYASLAVFESDRRFMRIVGSYPGATQPAPDRSVWRADHMGVAGTLGYEDGVEFVPLHIAGRGAQTMAALWLRRGWSIALLHGGVAQGMFTVGRMSGEPFEPEDLAFLSAASKLLGGAVFEEVMVANARQETARSRILNDLSILLSAGEPVDALFERLRDLLAEAIAFDYVDLLVAHGPGMMRVVGSEPQVYKAAGELESLAESQIDGLVSEGGTTTQYRSDRVPGPWTDALARAGIIRNAGAVLRQEDEILGALGLGRRRNLAFTDTEMAFVETVATLLTQAVANQRRIERSEADARRAQLLNELSVLINAGEPVDALFDRIKATVRQAIAFDFLALHVANEGKLRLVGVEPAIVLRDTPERTPEEVGIADVFRDDNNLAEFRPTEHSAAAIQVLANAGMKRALAVRLGEPGAQLGVLTFARKSEAPFDPRDMSFAGLLGMFLSQAIASHERVRASEAEAEEQRVVAAVAAVVASAADWNALVAGLVRPLRLFVPRPYSALGYVEGNQIIYPDPRGGLVVRPIQKYAELAAETGQVVLDGLPDDSAEFATSRRFGVQTLSITPCQSNGVTVGYLLAGSRLEGHKFSERDLRLIRLMTQISGPAIANMLAAQQTARERETYHRALNSLSEAVILLDHDRIGVFANPLGEAISLTIDPDRLSRRPEDYLHGLREDLRGPFEAAFVRGEPQQGRTHLMVGGKPCWLDYELIPLDDPHVRLLAVGTDVTAQVEQEAERERHREEMEQTARLAALGELVGGVAHELNNPLTAILGFADLLAGAPDGDAPSEEIEVIRKEALRARDIVRDLLFIARPGRVELGDVSLADVLGHVERLRRPEWALCNTKVTIERRGLDRLACGNEHQLTQVLLNLVTNAEHAVRDVPDPRIDVRLEVDEDEALIEVEDNGHGMDAATMDRIFEPFFTTKHGDGTGLGLSLSRTIVKAHGGEIEATSVPEKGTKFRVTIPSRPCAPPAMEAAVSAPQAGSARVLIVDDEPSLRVLIQRLVARLGHHCSVAANGREAVALAAIDDFDLVICDYRLASETADSVVAGLLEIAPQLLDRIVIATGATTDAGVVRLTERHSLPLLAKPYGIKDLAQVIERAASRGARGAAAGS